MHRGLSIEEILREICFHLRTYSKRDTSPDGEWLKHGGRHYSASSLATMARTCKSFSDPALDELWASVDLHSLLHCVPNGVLHRVGLFDRGEFAFEPRRAIEPSDGARPRFYAARVKHLIGQEALVDPRVLLALGLDFSRVHCLDWYGPLGNFSEFHSTLLGPSFTAVRLEVTKDASLTTLAVRHPQLKEIHIAYVTYEDLDDEEEAEAELLQQTSAASAFLCSLPSLEKVVVDGVTCESLVHLALCANLRSLHMDDTYLGTFPADLPRWTTDIRAFPALEDLRVHAPPSGTIQLLGWCAKVPVKNPDFHIVAQRIPTGPELHEIFSMLPAAISHCSLAHLSLDTIRYRSEFGGLERVDCLITSDSIRALSHFSSLTTVHIRCAVGVDLDDTAALELAHGCPLLRTLLFDARYEFPGQPRATLQCLRHFARYCRSLEDLAVTLDATVIPEPDSQDDATPPQLTLSSFNFQWSPISDSSSVAHLLRSVFPKLGRLAMLANRGATLGGEFRIHYYLWKEVASLIPGCTMN
ncbi:hypothetical protein FB45DRAFT_1065161 [Roridomyces roridus]|uniref:F-box domain-containing protein n=1 Tax=Roridomyces roridus TaxID=1738132 RepID=A0AAD7B8G0_9AGAR|nr:hypothetical protein FB45DRAFT_1065161 [Roridomyces roridus]